MLGLKRVLGLVLILCIFFPLLMQDANGVDVTLEELDSQIWDVTGCMDSDGDMHVAYCTPDGLVFSDYDNGEMINEIYLTTDDAQEPSIVYCEDLDVGNGYFLIAYIVERDFFNTDLMLYRYDGEHIVSPLKITGGARFHNPSLSFSDDGTNRLYLAFDQGGSADGSIGFSNDIAITLSDDFGETWEDPIIPGFNSFENEMGPSLHYNNGKMHISFVRNLDSEAGSQGNAQDIESTALYTSHMSNDGIWEDPVRITYDIAEVTDPFLLSYKSKLIVVWQTNVGESGIENIRTYECHFYDGSIWGDQKLFTTTVKKDLVPLYITYTDNLLESGEPIPAELSSLSNLDHITMNPCMELDTYQWKIESDSIDNIFRKDIEIGNSGESVLRGYIEVPKSSENIVLSSTKYDFEVGPKEVTKATLQAEVDSPGEYELTIFVRSNDAEKRVIPIFVEINIQEKEDNFFKNFIEGDDDNITDDDDNITDDDDNITDDDDGNVTDGKKDDKDNNAIYYVIGSILVIALVLVIIFFLIKRMQNEEEGEYNSEMAIFFIALILMASMAPLIGGVQGQEITETKLIDEEIVPVSRKRLNITDPLEIGSSIEMNVRDNSSSITSNGIHFTTASQVISANGLIVDGIFFYAKSNKESGVPVEIIASDLESQRVLGRTTKNISGEMREYYFGLGNNEATDAILVTFTTKDTISGEEGSRVFLGCAANSSANMSEIIHYSRDIATVGGDSTERYRIDEMINSDPIAIGLMYVYQEIELFEFMMDKYMFMLDATNEKIEGSLVIINNMDYNISTRIRIVCYDTEGNEYGIANEFIDIEKRNLTDRLSFNFTSSLGIHEGRHSIVIGIYHQDYLIYRYGDDPNELRTTTFMVSKRRIIDASVLPTDRIRPGGHINYAILKIENIDREVNDEQVEEIRSKLQDVAEEYQISYNWEEITDLEAFTDFMENRNENYALINTHGSSVPLPEKYINEYRGNDETVLLMHFNEETETPQDSSSKGNIVELMPKIKQPNNAVWLQNEGPYGMEENDYLPCLIDGLIELPITLDEGKDPNITSIVMDLWVKMMDLPEKGSYSTLATFWNRTRMVNTVFIMNIWNSRENNGKVELEIRTMDDQVSDAVFFELPYCEGFNIGDWLDIGIDIRSSSTKVVVKNTRTYFDFRNTTEAFGLGGGIDGSTIDSLLLGNIDNNGLIDWESTPLMGLISKTYYVLSTGPDHDLSTLDNDLWEFNSSRPTHHVESRYDKNGMVYSIYNSDHGIYKEKFHSTFAFDGWEWLEVKNNENHLLQEFTLEFLINIDHNPLEGYEVLLVSKSPKDDNIGFHVSLMGLEDNSNAMRFSIGDGSELYSVEFGTPDEPALTHNHWHKICAIHDGQHMALHIDGLEVGLLETGVNIEYDSSPILIGGNENRDHRFEGGIEEIILSKGFDITNHNLEYRKWMGTIATWISSYKSTWINPVGYPFGYLGFEEALPLYYGETLLKHLMSPLTFTPGNFFNSGVDGIRSPNCKVLDEEFESLELPERIEYDYSCLSSREGSMISLYIDEEKETIPSGAIRIGKGVLSYSSAFSPDLTMILSMLRLPNDYLLHTLNGEHFKGEDIIVNTILTNPTDEIETYIVNLTVIDPFSRESVAHTKNVTILPGREAEVILLFRPKTSAFPKGTYRMTVSVVREDDGLLVDLWGDTEIESSALMINLIDDLVLEILDFTKEISHNTILQVPVRVTNMGALPAYVNLELTVISPSGSNFVVKYDEKIKIPSHQSCLRTLEWDPASAAEEQIRNDLVVDIPFGDYKCMVAMYDAESVLYTSSMINAKAKDVEKTIFYSDDMEHTSGSFEEANGWSIEPSGTTSPGYLCKSLSTNDLEDGEYMAQFDLMIRNNDGPNEKVANISVWFGDEVVSYREVYRHDFINSNSYQFFSVSFDTIGRRNQPLSFRTFWEGNCYLKQDKVEVIPYKTAERIENLELKTRPLDYEMVFFSMLAETQITARLYLPGETYVSAELFYSFGNEKGSFIIPKTGKYYTFTLFHHPDEEIFIDPEGLGNRKDMHISVKRTVETFVIEKKGAQTVDVDHGRSDEIVDKIIDNRISKLKIWNTLTLKDLNVIDNSTNVTAGFDDEFSRAYVQINTSKDWAEFEVCVPESKAQRISLEAFEEPGKEIVLIAQVRKAQDVHSEDVDMIELSFAFLGGSGLWVQNSTNVHLSGGKYIFRISPARDGYQAKMYFQIFVTPLPTFDHGESANDQIESAGNSIMITVQGIPFKIDLSWIPKIPKINIPGIEVPNLDPGGILELSIVDSDREETEALNLGERYYLRIRLEYEYEPSDDDDDSDDSSSKNKKKSSGNVMKDKPGIESITFIVGVEVGFDYSEDPTNGVRYGEIESFGVFELGIKIKIRLKSYSNPGTLLLDLMTGGAGGSTPGAATAMNALFGALKKIGIDISAGLYLLIEANAIFTPHFKLTFNIYPLANICIKIEIDFFFFSIEIINLELTFILPIGLTVVVDSAPSPWEVSLELWLLVGGRLRIFGFTIFDGSLRLTLIKVYLT